MFVALYKVTLNNSFDRKFRQLFIFPFHDFFFSSTEMAKFSLVWSVVAVVAFVVETNAQGVQYINMTLYNVGHGDEYFVWIEVTLAGRDAPLKSKEIGFNEHDSVTFSTDLLRDINVYKRLVAATGGNSNKELIKSLPVKLKTTMKICYEATGSFSEARVDAIACPE